ncbi:MAG: 3-methyl-2-oxobutanoate dehydrogenase subunit beta [Promethearchaeota archaeon]
MKKTVSIKELRKEKAREYFLAGNSTCAGCGLELALRWAMKALGPRTVLVAPASCLNVVVGLWPKTAPDFPFINMAFAAGAAAASGVRAALDARGVEDVNVLVFAGDGGTTDIGLQGLSGAAERGDDIIYCCYDNEAYMNTGRQRSSSTPYGALTTTTPLGKVRQKKNLPRIMAAHDLPYVATASVSDVRDLYQKFLKAKDIRGCKYIHVLAPCPPGWRYPSSDTVQIARLAVETGMWVLYEIENGVLRLTGKSKSLLDKTKRKPVVEYLVKQGRFKKVLANEGDVTVLQDYVDRSWRQLAHDLEFSCSP